MVRRPSPWNAENTSSALSDSRVAGSTVASAWQQSRNVTTRLARLLLVSSESEGQPTDDGILLTLELSQSEIAHLLGTAREVVSRAFRHLEQEGLVIRTRNGVLIREPEKLEEMAHRRNK